MKWLLGMLAGAFLVLLAMAQGAAAQYNSSTFDAGMISGLPEMRRLIDQVDPGGNPQPPAAMMELYGHILSQQRAVIGNEPVSQARFEAIVDYLARFAVMQDTLAGTGRQMLEAFQNGLNGYSRQFAGRPVYSIFEDPARLIGGTPQTSGGQDRGFFGTYTKTVSCDPDPPWTTTAEVTRTGVHITVANWACLKGDMIDVTATRGVFSTDPAAPNALSLGTAGNIPGAVTGTLTRMQTGEVLDLVGDYWVFGTTDMTEFHLLSPLNRDRGIDVRFP